MIRIQLRRLILLRLCNESSSLEKLPGAFWKGHIAHWNEKGAYGGGQINIGRGIRGQWHASGVPKPKLLSAVHGSAVRVRARHIAAQTHLTGVAMARNKTLISPRNSRKSSLSGHHLAEMHLFRACPGPLLIKNLRMSFETIILTKYRWYKRGVPLGSGRFPGVGGTLRNTRRKKFDWF